MLQEVFSAELDEQTCQWMASKLVNSDTPPTGVGRYRINSIAVATPNKAQIVDSRLFQPDSPGRNGTKAEMNSQSYKYSPR